MKKLFLFFVCFSLAACSTSQNPAPYYTPDRSDSYKTSSVAPYYKVREPVQCVPYARDVSGLDIMGDAYTWWGQANGKYARGKTPQVGAVLVLSKTSRLKYGHLAVVKKIRDTRTIEVDHSNWGSSTSDRCVIYRSMPVKDVSPNNDWSQLRFYNYPSKSFGSVYAASGFIYSPKQTRIYGAR